MHWAKFYFYRLSRGASGEMSSTRSHQKEIKTNDVTSKTLDVSYADGWLHCGDICFMSAGNHHCLTNIQSMLPSDDRSYSSEIEDDGRLISSSDIFGFGDCANFLNGAENKSRNQYSLIIARIDDLKLRWRFVFVARRRNDYRDARKVSTYQITRLEFSNQPRENAVLIKMRAFSSTFLKWYRGFRVQYF